MSLAYPPSPRRPGSGLSLVLAGAAFVMTLYLVWDRMRPRALHGDAAPRVVTPRGELSDVEKSVIAVYETSRTAVVHITSPEVMVRDRRSFTGYGTLPEGTGSGFVWDARGYVVTNYHVIQARREVLVRLHDGKELAADVVDADPTVDVAVLKLRNPPSGLQPILIGDSVGLRVGQTVLAIGNPFGLDQTLTTGVISALDRTMETIAGTEIQGVIQTDATINPGNSGGPLLDSAGRLIGMNTAIRSPTGVSAGIGFAVPVNTINRVVPKLIAGTPPSPGLGVSSQRVPVEGTTRLMIQEVVDGSGAAAAGLRGLRITRGGEQWGDVLLRVGEQEIERLDDLYRVLDQHKIGDRVPVTVLRGLPQQSEEVTVEVELTPVVRGPR